MTDIREMLKFDEPTFVEGSSFMITKIRTILDYTFYNKSILLKGGGSYFFDCTENSWFEVINQSSVDVTVTSLLPIFSTQPSNKTYILKNQSRTKFFYKNRSYYAITQQIT